MKILVIRFSSAGDILCTTPTLRALRKRFPDGRITFLTKSGFAGLLETNRHVDRIIRYRSGSTLIDDLRLRVELRREEFDLVVDLHDSLRSRLIRFGIGSESVVYRKDPLRRLRRHSAAEEPGRPVPLRFLDACSSIGLEDDRLGLELPIRPGRRILPESLPRPVFAIAPGAHHYTKRWPAARYAAALAELLVRTGGSGVIVGGGEDELVAEEVLSLLPFGIRNRITDLTGATDWQQTAAAIASADVLIANDSVAGHIAAAVGTPVVSIFGSTSPVFGFVPFRIPGVVEEVNDLECRPCTTIGRAECPLGHFRCMLDIESGRVVESAMSLVGR